MLQVNKETIEQKLFPDKTPLIHFDPIKLKSGIDDKAFEITWLYENMGEVVNLAFLVCKIRDCIDNPRIRLVCPYLPNARMDREEKPDDVFTLKYFAELINSFGFDEIETFDVHSARSLELLDNAYDVSPRHLVACATKDIGRVNLRLFYPDEGAMKRYSNSLDAPLPFAYAVKERDWASGKITGLVLHGGDIQGRDFLIVDDICSKGGTFYYAAKALKEAGANDVFLCVSHCENTIFEGRLIEGDEITHIYTTNSIYAGDCPKITAYKFW